MDRESPRDDPDDVADADATDGEARAGDAAVRRRSDEAASAELLTDAALQPDDPVEGEAARRGADPDMASDPRGEEP